MIVVPLPHHDGSAFYVDDPEPTLGDIVTVWLRVPASTRAVRVRYTPDADPVFLDAIRDTTRPGCLPGEQWWRAALPARNPVTRYRFQIASASGQCWLNALGVANHDVPDTYDFRLIAYAPPPAWASDAIIYEIFPDRFARSAAAASRPVPDWAIGCDWDEPVIGHGAETPRQFYGGDLDGVVEHLDHIASLGANTVYLTPVFPAQSNHRYNASSFDTIDPLLGGEAALERLSRALKTRGLRLLGDVTTNHCGDARPWMVQALAAEIGAPERDLFYLDDNNHYEAWWDHPTLPKLNWGNPEVRRRFLDGPESIIAKWLPYLNGWRIDVANMTGRCRAEDSTHEVARLLRKAIVAVRPDALVVAEHAHDFSDDLDRDGWHGTMNYAGFTRPIWNWLRSDQLELDHYEIPDHRGGIEAVATMRAFAGLVSWRSLAASWTILSSHDTPRIRTICQDAARTEVAIGLMMTYPGTPMIFAGDEWGLTGLNGEDSRVPMPWHKPESWDTGTLNAYRRLAALRSAHPALRSGSLRWVHVSDNLLTFLRETEQETLLVCARRSAGEPVALRGLARENRPVNLYGGADLPSAEGVSTLPGDGPTFQVWHL